MVTEIFSYLAGKGYSLRDSGADQWVTNCPYCGKKDHFYINKNNGLWDCKSGSCGKKGSFSTLKKHFGDDFVLTSPFSDTAFLNPEKKSYPEYSMSLCTKYHEELLADEKQMRWLKEERGLTEETIKHFKLGLKKDKFSVRANKHIDWIGIPLTCSEKLVNVKYRSGAGEEKDFSFIPKSMLPMFNHDGVEKDEPLILCEGEFDAMILWQNGFKNVLSTSAGAGTFKTEWYDYIKNLNPQVIYVVYDNDSDNPANPGQKYAQEIVYRFGEELAKNIILPEGKDPTDYFVKHKHTSDEFRVLLNKAAMADVESVYGSVEVLDRLILETEGGVEKFGLQTQFDNVNRLIGGGMCEGEVIVLTARAKIGKTTFAQNITYDMCVNAGAPVLFMCLEMRPERTMRKMVSMITEIDDANLTTSDFRKAKEIFADLPFYFSYFWETVNMDHVEKVFTLARKRYGIKIGVFDNLHFLCRNVNHIVQEVGIVSKRFKQLAEKLKIPIILIVQPRRVDANNIPSSEDLKDSSAIKADADKVVILHRVPMAFSPEVGSVGNNMVDLIVSPLEESLHPITMVKCDASRFSSGGQSLLWFDGAKSKYRYATSQEIEDFKILYNNNEEQKKSFGKMRKISNEY